MNNLPLIYLDWHDLEKNYFLSLERDSAQAEEVKLLVSEAKILLISPNLNVTQKTGCADSGDKHDFFAIGAYSWPNPNSFNALPYVYRDSEPNPEARDSTSYDKGRYEEFIRRVSILTLAWYFTKENAYSIKAVEMLREWFIAPETKMNPNFRYAAARPGEYNGHFSGVIEGVLLIELLDYITIISTSEIWSTADSIAISFWFQSLSTWLVKSKFGRLEVHSENNHGSWYLAQVLVFSRFSNNDKRAREILPLAVQQLRKQVGSNGFLPHELSRADALFYSVYGLRAFIVLAKATEHYGENLWKIKDKSHNSSLLEQALVSLSPYVSLQVPWPGKKIDTPYHRYALQIYRIAEKTYCTPILAQTLTRLELQNGDQYAWDSLLSSFNRSTCSQRSGVSPIILSERVRDFEIKNHKFRHFRNRIIKAISLIIPLPGKRIG